MPSASRNSGIRNKSHSMSAPLSVFLVHPEVAGIAARAVCLPHVILPTVQISCESIRGRLATIPPHALIKDVVTNDNNATASVRITDSVHQRPLTVRTSGRLVQRVLDRVLPHLS